MCGITGIFLFYAPNQTLARRIHYMTNTISHRGPDDEGYCLINTSTQAYRLASGDESVAEIRDAQPLINELDGDQFNLAFGHRRFSLLDLSSGGHQPSFDSSRKIIGIFNGFIYNYKEIRAELQANGLVFHTNCDTEVLFNAYGFWGEQCFVRLNGTWALAIYDFGRRELILSRDRLGKKPFYFYRDYAGIYFASEIKAILKIINTPVSANKRAVFDYLVSEKRDLNNSTFYEGIKSITAGSVLKIDLAGKITSTKYWELRPARDGRFKSASPYEAAKELRNILEDAVRIRLRCDVDIGIELSGGLDSSSIAGLASIMHANKLPCYTVSYPQIQFNEEPYAREVAMCFKMDYHVVSCPEHGFWNKINDFVAMHEEPFLSPNLYTQQVVWRMMHKAGIRVILYGAGGDELFAGYRIEYFYRYLRDLLRRRELSRFLNNFVGFTELSPIKLAAKALKQFLPSFRSEEFSIRRLLGVGLQDVPADIPNGKTMEEQLYLNMTELMMPYWLRSNDKNAMAIPVEIRAPLLDYRLVEFAFQLPVDFLIRNGWMKWILRQAMKEVLPPAITWRRLKMGYPFPLQDWLHDSMINISALFADNDNPYLNKPLIRANLDRWISHHPGIVWRLVSLELWHKRFIRGESV